MVILHIKFKGITKCSNMVASILPADSPPIDPRCQKIKILLFQNNVMIQYHSKCTYLFTQSSQAKHLAPLPDHCLCSHSDNSQVLTPIYQSSPVIMGHFFEQKCTDKAYLSYILYNYKMHAYLFSFYCIEC